MSRRQERHAAKWAKLKAKQIETNKRVEEKQSPPGKPAPKPGDKK